MWATTILAASFTMLILTALGIVPAWKQPYPESAMRQALLVLSAAAGWLLGLIPLTVAFYRQSTPWPKAATGTAAYALLAATAVVCIALGTARTAHPLSKAAALIAGFGFPALSTLVLRGLLCP